MDMSELSFQMPERDLRPQWEAWQEHVRASAQDRRRIMGNIAAQDRAEKQASFIAGQISKLPARWAADARREHAALEGKYGQVVANRWLLDHSERAERCRLDPGATDGDISHRAAKLAREALSLAGAWKVTDLIRPALERMCRSQGIYPPGVQISDRGAIARVTDRLWWRRRLRAVHARQAEELAIELGYVHSHADRYASNEAVRRRQQQQRRNRSALENTEAISEDGEVLNLAEITDGSLSNKAIRRGELMTRVRGLEEEARGFVGWFITLTCPSRMHARQQKSGEPNPTYDGTTPNQAHKYLCGLWQKIRAKFARGGIVVFGLRIAEPHHDGTPHWHMLMFCMPRDVASVQMIVRRYALQDSPDELGADKHRAEFVQIDPCKGSAVGYVAKYVSKNLDGVGVGLDSEGGDAVSNAARVEAWAATHGIRQFQFFGTPPVGVWRELRRVPADEVEGAPEVVQEAWDAVQRRGDRTADFGRFIRAMGGVGIKRGAHVLRIVTEWCSTRCGRYGEPIGERPVGVAVAEQPGTIYKSARKLWNIVTKAGGAIVRAVAGHGPLDSCQQLYARNGRGGVPAGVPGAPPGEYGGFMGAATPKPA